MTSPHLLDHPYPVADYRFVERFLVLGHERGTYDAPALDVREVPTPALDRWLAEDGVRVVRDAAAFLTSGRAYRPEPALHVLARAITAGPAAAREEALALLPAAVRTSGQLFSLLRFVRGRTPWSGPLKEAIGTWYATRSTAELATLIVRAPAEGAWSHREALRAVRPKPPTPAHEALFRWLVDGTPPNGAIDDRGLELVAAFARLQETTAQPVARVLVERWPILREVLPAGWHQDRRIIEAIVATLSGEGLVRWVLRLAEHGVLGANDPAAVLLVRRLAALDTSARAALPPFLTLSAWATVRYQAATGQTPPTGLEGLLYDLFHEAMAGLPRSTDPLVVAIDPAASTALDGLPACPGLDPRTALAALAMLAVACCRRPRLVAFGPQLEPLELGAGAELRSLLGRLERIPAGTVDGSAPIEAALADDQGTETFLILSGTRPADRALAPEAVLQRYRAETRSEARWIGVSVGRERLAASPPLSLDALEVHGFDLTVPALLTDLLRTPVPPRR